MLDEVDEVEFEVVEAEAIDDEIDEILVILIEVTLLHIEVDDDDDEILGMVDELDANEYLYFVTQQLVDIM